MQPTKKAKALLTPFGRLRNEFILWPIDSARKKYAAKCVLCSVIVHLRMCRAEHIYGIYTRIVAYIVHFIQIFLALHASISGSLQLHVWSGL